MVGTNTAREHGVIEDSAEGKGHSFRKRKLSLTNLREHGDAKKMQPTLPTIKYASNGSHEPHGKQETTVGDQFEQKKAQHLAVDDGRAHSFRKRRLSLTQNREESSLDDDPSSPSQNHLLDRSALSIDSSMTLTKGVQAKKESLISRIVHAPELLAHPPSSPIHDASDNRLYEQSSRPKPQSLLDATGDESLPTWKKRHTRHQNEDERKLPFPRDIVGTFSCHGIEPLYEDDYSLEEKEGSDHMKHTTAAKINQDRGGVAFPYGNCPRTALFAVYDGHGQGGELVSQFALHEIQSRLEKHDDFTNNIKKAFQETFLSVDESLKKEILIEALYAGTTACVALLRENKLVLSNAGDSRAVLAKKSNDSWTAVDLTKDQNPDLPEEMARIQKMGGFVTPPPEPGLSARVWLDEDCTQIGLAMARSLGDHAVKPIGVIAEPVVTIHDVRPEDDFVILATDGVWEFISSDEAVQLVARNLASGATKACQALIEAAATKWHDEEGDYRDDITALVVRLRHLWASN
ncbi:unnamed protein product [Cylindrotheca closterium]|uniref:PPM-type phosphatase domain-containing protein n=1 Tax=Cylindrotheca closterium TaxID=2856 RepID=A0AAD2JN58_9STRA|nr:unnamed protein product [Cylindrotheca closterium]